MGIYEKVRGAVADSRIAAFISRDSTKIFSVIGAVAILMTLSAAGILSGAGLFLLAMISMDTFAVVWSSILLSVSVAVFLAGYIWLTR